MYSVRFRVLLLATVSAFACFFCSMSQGAPAQQSQLVDLNGEFDEADAVVIDGQLTVKLWQITGGERNYYHLTGTQGQPVQVVVRDHVLHIVGNQATVSVGINPIHQLVVNGASSVTAINLKTQNFSVAGNTRGNIYLEGMVGLKSVTYQGSGKLSLQWINSPRVQIEGSGSGYIYLGGVTQDLDIRIAGSNHVNAQFLRAKNALIQTSDSAIAEVHVSDSLQAFASDKSNIYYYTRPKSINRSATDDANILQYDWRR